ncbi:hypothetical protein CEXT_539711 [Caerostris extrusa]|uniref:Uncharacterized protein n=1 Tax=Caerostris extrusa TaxID=172846 RepID=A0AAV4W4S7_CAEEX|nr:hypothetical protein CEXT_539711 [Caerostris extrusa]
MYCRHTGCTKLSKDGVFATDSLSESSFEVIGQDTSSAESTEKVKENSQITSEDVIQEPIKEGFQESISEDKNKNSEYRESTKEEELQELCTIDKI